MPGPDLAQQRREAQKWLTVADRDLATAGLCVDASPPHLESAAYFVQQAAEKLFKAALVLAACDLPRTHNLKVLVNLAAPRFPDLADAMRGLVPLTPWGLAYRYPFEEEPEAPPNREEVVAALQRVHSFRAGLVTRLEG